MDFLEELNNTSSSSSSSSSINQIQQDSQISSNKDKNVRRRRSKSPVAAAAAAAAPTFTEVVPKNSSYVGKKMALKRAAHSTTTTPSLPSSSTALASESSESAAAPTITNQSMDGTSYERAKRKRYNSFSTITSAASTTSNRIYKSSSQPSSNVVAEAKKRKRRSSTCCRYDKDTDIGFDAPKAKRPQHAALVSIAEPTLYKEAESQLLCTNTMSATTVYRDSTDILVDDLLSTKQSITASELHSVPSPLPDSPDSPPSPDRGSYTSAATTIKSMMHYDTNSDTDIDDDNDVDVINQFAEKLFSDEKLDTSFSDDTASDDDGDDDNVVVGAPNVKNDNDDIISSSTSPAPSSTNSHHGERTPGAQLSQSAQNINNNNNNSNNSNKKVVPKGKSFGGFISRQYKHNASQIEVQRPCPLPALSWANAADVWQLMCIKDQQAASQRSSYMLERHPCLQPRMRAILLDWLIEVCEVYKLHRETYYLAVDYLDRFLNVSKDAQKTHLQLIGITCLFVAAKAEEIYPPKIGEFAYVTDGACTEVEILHHEKLLLQSLNWQISPVTAIGWLGVYMQLNMNNRTPASLTTIAKEYQSSKHSAEEVDDAFIYPQFSGMEFVQTAQLLDLCSLHVGMADYSYSVIAAAALSHTFNRETALRCSGLDWETIMPCARWMEPFFQVISNDSPYLCLNEQNEQLPSKFGLAQVCPNIVADDSHIIQTHKTTLDMFDQVLLLQHQIYADKIKQECSPATGLICPAGLLTPPTSSQKPLEEVEPSNQTYYDKLQPPT